MDENRDRLIDILLREELASEQPPDLTGKIVARAFPHQYRFPVRRYLLAASVLFVVGLLSWWLWPRYPEPKASGSFELVSGAKVQRGAVLRTKDRPAALELGGYTRVEIKPGTTLRIDGEKYAENIAVELGEVQCAVKTGVGSFGVRTSLSAVSVVGTDFTVRVVEERGADRQSEKAVLVRVVTGTVALAGEWGDARLAAGEEQLVVTGRERKPEVRAGVAIGSVTAKFENWIEVKSDPEEKARRYMPAWVGGADGRPDPNMIRTIGRTPIGARVRVEWRLEERPRAIKLDVLQLPDGREPRAEESGKTVGVLVAKTNESIDVRADGEATGRQYLLHFGGTPDLRAVIREIPVNSRVQLDWIVAEDRRRVVKLQPLSPPR